LLETGIKITGDNALLLASLGWIHEEYLRMGLGNENNLVKAEEYASKALTLDQDTTLAYITLAMVHYLQGNLKKGTLNFKKALSLDPNNVETIQWIPWSYILIGKTEDAVSIVDHLLDIDPLNPVRYIQGVVCFYLGKFEQAVNIFRTFIKQFDWARWWLAYYLVYVNRKEEAIHIFGTIEESSLTGFQFYCAKFLKYVVCNESYRIPELMTDEFIGIIKRDAIISCWIATFYAMLNDKENCLFWLENSVNRGFINYPYMSKYDPFLAKLRDDPRFRKLMAKVKHEWENFEV
jgi:non-specific serine/threonine protein kinase